MPHVVLNRKIPFRDVYEKIHPLFLKENDVILKTSRKYIDSEGTAVLIEALVIAEKRKSDFLILLSRREDGVVVRLYPNWDITKTDNVKKLLAEIAKQLLDLFPSLEVGKTNLEAFLTE